jgi:hypothetical protein
MISDSSAPPFAFAALLSEWAGSDWKDFGGKDLVASGCFECKENIRAGDLNCLLFGIPKILT